MIVIRADANEIIGTGHVMRCRSVADALEKAGQDVAFIVADNRTKKLLGDFKSICLNSDWTDMEGELNKLLPLLNDLHPKACIIDSYYVTDRYLKEIKEITKTAYFDDLNDSCWELDVLINYNIFGTSLDYSGYKKNSTMLCLGPQYAPLRNEFIGLPKREIENKVADVLVSAGGVDPQKVTECIINNICPKWPTIRFHFVVGKLNPRIADLKKFESGNIILHIDEKNMSGLMMNCDVAVSAAGTTLYELCATGIPTVTYSLADNQLVATKEFESQGIMLSAGDYRDNDDFTIALEEKLTLLLDGKEKRKELSGKMQSLVDGRGAVRVADEILNIGRNA